MPKLKEGQVPMIRLAIMVTPETLARIEEVATEIDAKKSTIARVLLTEALDILSDHEVTYA